MPRHKREKSIPEVDFIHWLNDKGKDGIYKEWCKNLSKWSLPKYVQENYPEVWREYTGNA